MFSNTSSGIRGTDNELGLRPLNRQRIDLGIHVERDCARIAQSDPVIPRVS